MARHFHECKTLLQNISLTIECPVPPRGGATLCCLGQCCFVNRSRREVWENWFFWFALFILVLLILSSLLSIITSTCKKRHQNLIRIGHATFPQSSPVGSMAGPGGIIQPHVTYNKTREQQLAHGQFIPNEFLKVEDLAGPLAPPYPPIEPISVVRGTAPPMGYRQTPNYTELVLPPGFTDGKR
ncbi:hypothetical protein M8J77_006584 [Diaphorina citri]|nr:hypothetical protein M8J77_006584 [Diaphorina citri]